MTDSKSRAILLVTDSPEEKVAIRSYLSSTSLNYEFIEANTQTEAVKLVEMFPFDCIILNSLPDSLETLQAFRKIPLLILADSKEIAPALESLPFLDIDRSRHAANPLIAHDLRNHLNSILGYTRLLRLLRNLPEQALSMLDIIERNGKAQQEILNHWLSNTPMASNTSLLPPTSAHAEGVSENNFILHQLTGIRLLVTDDDPDSCELLHTELTSMGAIVIVATSGQEALAYLSAAPLDAQFDLFISDISLPDEDGYTLMRKVRQLPHCSPAQLPAIALTALSQAEDRVHCLRAGFQTYISKPVDPLDLSTVIQALLNIRR